jgi:hypothetical protein
MAAGRVEYTEAEITGKHADYLCRFRGFSGAFGRANPIAK